MTRPAQPFGLWKSPISAKSLASGRRLHDVFWDDDGETLVWLEGRGDRGVLVASRIGSGEGPRDLTDDLSVRARVHYGGGDFTVGRGAVWFANAQDGRLWRLALAGGAARPVSPAGGNVASPRLSPCGRFVSYVHHDEGGVDRIAVVDGEGAGWPAVLARGADFYTQQRWSPDGQWLAWVEWNHPHMPWDGATLKVAAVESPLLGTTGTLPRLGEARSVAGGDSEAVFQPEFSPDSSTLLYVTDESGWWHLHSLSLKDGGATPAKRAITKGVGGEYGLPNWIQEMRTFAVTPGGRSAFAALNKSAFVSLVEVDLESGVAKAIAPLTGYTDASQLTVSPKSGRLAFIGSSPSQPARVICFDPRSEVALVVARSTTESLRPTELSTPVAVSYPTAGLGEAHGLYYPPVGLKAGEGKPPLIVIVHGGPTSQVRASWSSQAQYFATRGWAVFYVNHRGGTGYGRAFMQKLRGTWGKVDVEDSVFGARWLAETGKVDGSRMAIMGGSAGGYTVLQTMVDQPEVFAAGVALYGIANQFTLAQGTHKFEAFYNDSLLGALPDAATLWRERSPVFHAARIKRPLAIFQGADDKVVPKDQADAIVGALKRTNTPHLYQVYEGEGHGWRKTETIEHFYKAVEAFLGEHLLFR